MVLLTKLFTNVPNQKIFCNTPWYEFHIYWDGSLGVCCQENHKIYTEGDSRYNIANMTIAEWFNSEPVKNFRRNMLGNTPVSTCVRCTKDENYGNDSRRLKGNQKSVIFTKTAFESSWKQSPGRTHFEHSINNDGATTSYPIDIHIDLGNYCNLACKMCGPEASTTIASQQVKWGIETSRPFLNQDWTRNPVVWEKFKQQLLEIPGLNQMHFMGGETLLTPRLENLVDFMIEHKRFDQCFSFVTNGTIYKHNLMEKLSKFKRVGIEISIESLGPQNNYVRQGTDTNLVLENIKKFESWCNGSNITVTLRTAPSALTIGTYVDLLRWALQKQFVVKSNILTRPRFMDIAILPDHVKAAYLPAFVHMLQELDTVNTTQDFNASDHHNVSKIIKQQLTLCCTALTASRPSDADQLLQQLTEHCKKWDTVYTLDARTMYPELTEIWDQHGY
jgi:molybdenum cofactor biosynthesis enzyme MoaA